jgi:sec-independent protein translocase protein TatA
MPFGMGFGELVLILLIVVVVFGATKLPQLGDGLGRAIKNFKRSVNSQNEIEVAPGGTAGANTKPGAKGALDEESERAEKAAK